jgi:chemotaxis protein histidine kinase CheA
MGNECSKCNNSRCASHDSKYCSTHCDSCEFKRERDRAERKLEKEKIEKQIQEKENQRLHEANITAINAKVQTDITTLNLRHQEQSQRIEKEMQAKALESELKIAELENSAKQAAIQAQQQQREAEILNERKIAELKVESDQRITELTAKTEKEITKAKLQHKREMETLKTDLQKYQLEHEKEMRALDNELELLKAEAVEKVRQLEEARREAENRIEAERQEHLEQLRKQQVENEQLLKSKDLANMKERFAQLSQSRHNLKDVIIKQYHTCVAVLEQLLTKESYLKSEENLLQTRFRAEHDRDVLRVVMYGRTGNGKSTLSNRICGDSSPGSDAGPFAVGCDVRSVTTEISKFIVKDRYTNKRTGKKLTVSVTDQPGTEDTDGRDRKFAIELVEYLRGIEFLNAIVIPKLFLPPRLDPTFKNMLLDLTKLLGKEVWKNIIIVLTNFPENKEGVNINKDHYLASARKMLNEDLDIPNVDFNDVPIVTVDCLSSSNSYREVIENLIENTVTSFSPFACKELVSPVEELRGEVSKVRMVFDKALGDWQHKMDQDKAWAEQLASLKFSITELDPKFQCEQATLQFPAEGTFPKDFESLRHSFWERFKIPDYSGSGPTHRNTAAEPTWDCPVCAQKNPIRLQVCGGCQLVERP